MTIESRFKKLGALAATAGIVFGGYKTIQEDEKQEISTPIIQDTEKIKDGKEIKEQEIPSNYPPIKKSSTIKEIPKAEPTQDRFNIEKQESEEKILIYKLFEQLKDQLQYKLNAEQLKRLFKTHARANGDLLDDGEIEKNISDRAEAMNKTKKYSETNPRLQKLLITLERELPNAVIYTYNDTKDTFLLEQPIFINTGYGGRNVSYNIDIIFQLDHNSYFVPHDSDNDEIDAWYASDEMSFVQMVKKEIDVISIPIWHYFTKNPSSKLLNTVDKLKKYGFYEQYQEILKIWPKKPTQDLTEEEE